MGLGDLIPDDVSEESASGSKRRYGHHEFNETLEEWVEELEERFPYDLNIDFIEVSPQLESNDARIYTDYDEDGRLYHYIRIRDGMWEGVDEDDESKYWKARQAILYLMVRAYFNVLGMGDIGPNRDEFKLVCGMVGAATNPVDQNDDEYIRSVTPFMSEEDNLAPQVMAWGHGRESPTHPRKKEEDNSIPAPEEDDEF